jgi:hypothetical protein
MKNGLALLALRSAMLLCCLHSSQGGAIGSAPQIRRVTIESADGPSAEEAAEAGAALREDGVVVLRCSALEALAPPLDNAKGILASMLARVSKTGLDRDQRFSFAEICHRAPRRYDVHLGAGTSQSEFSMLVNSLCRPVISECMGSESSAPSDDSIRIIRDGLVTSLPGASAQPFHADGRAAGLFNAFLPLVAVRTQGTEFWVSSHIDDDHSKAARLKADDETGEYIGETLLDDDGIAPCICSPTLSRAEGIVLFDYRVIHRGRAHGSHEVGVRPMFYRVFAIGDVAEDVHNWPERSLADLGG